LSPRKKTPVHQTPTGKKKKGTGNLKKWGKEGKKTKIQGAFKHVNPDVHRGQKKYIPPKNHTAETCLNSGAIIRKGCLGHWSSKQ